MRKIAASILGIALLLCSAFTVLAHPFDDIADELYPTGMSIFATEEGEPNGAFTAFQFSREISLREHVALMKLVLTNWFNDFGPMNKCMFFIVAYESPRMFTSIVADFSKEEFVITEEWIDDFREDYKYRIRTWPGDVDDIIDYLYLGVQTPQKETVYGRDLDAYYDTQIKCEDKGV